MMTRSLPTGRRGQVLAVALVMLTVCLIWIVLIDPIRALYADRDRRLAQRAALAERMAALADAVPELRQRADAAETSPSSLIDAPSDAAAAAQLQEAVQQLAAAAGASLSSAETLPAESIERHRRIGLRVSSSGPYPVLVDLIARVAQAQPTMLIDGLDIRAAPIVWRGQVAALSTEFTIYGFRVAGSE